ncbi:DUF736 domain-containing protein [Acidiphilium iwatense]|uniref:DUF736 domain-containing protein n=1 Tax=Acidiphilium iwatense TaxID=768198 RepID=A0ABS9DXB5_9PROT|nr:DUF736 domain-containing protein [Acidiphilium iwatense]MCF3947370.1 DUF736 domain-containing protein [Acidiphilium iwatense]
MSMIGQFTRDEKGYIGNLDTLLLQQDIIIVPAEPSDAENAPDYRVHVFDAVNNETGSEIGAGWKRTGEKAGNYVALQIDDPSFAQPIRANLFQSTNDKASWGLHWTRPPKRGDRD